MVHRSLSSEALYSAGMEYLKVGHWSKNAEAYLSLAADKELQKVGRGYGYISERNRSGWLAIVALGKLYEMRGDYTQAIVQFQKVIDWKEKYSSTLYNDCLIELGLLYQRGVGCSRDYHKALNYYDRVKNKKDEMLYDTTKADLYSSQCHEALGDLGIAITHQIMAYCDHKAEDKSATDDEIIYNLRRLMGTAKVDEVLLKIYLTHARKHFDREAELLEKLKTSPARSPASASTSSKVCPKTSSQPDVRTSVTPSKKTKDESKPDAKPLK